MCMCVCVLLFFLFALLHGMWDLTDKGQTFTPAVEA